MKAGLILPPKTDSEKIRLKIAEMMDKHGQCLNLWPVECQREYDRLAKLLRQMESDHES
jgi:hypothetical protein